MLGLWGRCGLLDLGRQQREANAQARRWVEAELQAELRAPVGRYDVTVTITADELRRPPRAWWPGLGMSPR